VELFRKSIEMFRFSKFTSRREGGGIDLV
jgi:hypothetical protein